MGSKPKNLLHEPCPGIESPARAAVPWPFRARLYEDTNPACEGVHPVRLDSSPDQVVIRFDHLVHGRFVEVERPHTVNSGGDLSWPLVYPGQNDDALKFRQQMAVFEGEWWLPLPG